MTLFLPYLSYYLAGNLIAKWRYPFGSWLVQVIGILVITGTIASFSYQNVRWYQQGVMTFWGDGGGQYFMEHFSPLVILLSLLTFSAVYHAFRFFPWMKSRPLSSMIALVASLTYGVYLVHPLVLDLLDHFAKMAVHLVTGNLFWYYLKKIVFAFGISALLSWTIKLLPGFKVILGEKPVVKVK